MSQCAVHTPVVDTVFGFGQDVEHRCCPQVLLDGGGEWAQQRGLCAAAGREMLMQVTRRLVEACQACNIRALTVRCLLTVARQFLICLFARDMPGVLH